MLTLAAHVGFCSGKLFSPGSDNQQKLVISNPAAQPLIPLMSVYSLASV